MRRELAGNATAGRAPKGFVEPASVSVVVPAFNEEKLIAETLRRIQDSLVAFRDRGWETEVIVCDNNSTDRTAELARAAGARVVFEPVNQIGRARNTGAAAAKGRWLIFVDADSHPSPELFSDVADHMQSGVCLAGGSLIVMEANTHMASLGVKLWNALSRWRTLLAGSFIFCEASTFRQVGGFSPHLFVGEELDLTVRLKKVAREMGKKIVILERFPLRTSPRKLHLYSNRDHAWFLLRSIVSLGRIHRNRDSCYTWYDGRR